MTAARSSSRVAKVDAGSSIEKKDVAGRVVEPLAPVTASSSGIEMLAQAKLSVGRVDGPAELEADEENAMRSADAIINRQKSARPTMKERQMLAEQAQQANIRYLEGSSGSSSTDSNADLGTDLGTDSNTDSDYEELWNASGETSPNYAPPRPTGPKPDLAPGRPTGPKPDLAPDRPTSLKPSFAPPRPTGPKPSFGGAAAESAYEVPVPNSTYAASRPSENIYEEIPDNIYEEIPDNASGASRSSSGGGYSQFGVDNSPIYEQPVVREEPIYEEPVVRNEPKKQKSKKPGVFDRMKNWFK